MCLTYPCTPCLSYLDLHTIIVIRRFKERKPRNAMPQKKMKPQGLMSNGMIP